jgi:hypothetical protein
MPTVVKDSRLIPGRMAMDAAASTRRSVRGGFDFSDAMRAVCRDITRRLPELSHVNMDRVAVACSQARKRVSHGLYATLTPMRFQGGRALTVRRGRQFTAQRLFDANGRELLYILRFYLPRFVETDLLYKLTTTVHELWHISPEFNGDLRRHAGRCYAHTHSQKQFDAQMQRLARRYFASSPPDETIGFLRLSFRQLIERYGRVYGIRVPQPKLIPVA